MVAVQHGFSARLHDACDSAGIKAGRGRTADLHNRCKKAGIDVSRESVRKWLDENSMPRMDNATQLACVVGVNVQWLLAGQGEKGGGVGGGAAVSLPKPGDEPRTIAGLLHAMHPELDSAPRDIREAIEALVLTYQADPKEGERIAKAMKTLLQKDT